MYYIKFIMKNNFFKIVEYLYYFSLVALLILYLFPGSLLGCIINDNCKVQPQLTSDYIVSSNHFYAFFILSVIGFFTYKNLNLLSVYLILLSIFLEILHSIIPNRSFEMMDLFGNLMGVVVVIILNFCFNYEKFKN